MSIPVELPHLAEVMTRYRFAYLLTASERARCPACGRSGADARRCSVLVIDGVGRRTRNNLIQQLDDRVGTRATLITNQLPVSAWHEWLNDPALADAILDRIVHAAHKIALEVESMRRKQAMP